MDSPSVCPARIDHRKNRPSANYLTETTIASVVPILMRNLLNCRLLASARAFLLRSDILACGNSRLFGHAYRSICIGSCLSASGNDGVGLM